jgi:hypothetical protein
MNPLCWLFDHDWRYRVVEPQKRSGIHYKGCELLYDAVVAFDRKELYCARCPSTEHSVAPTLPRHLPFRWRVPLWKMGRWLRT